MHSAINLGERTLQWPNNHWWWFNIVLYWCNSTQSPWSDAYRYVMVNFLNVLCQRNAWIYFSLCIHTWQQTKLPPLVFIDAPHFRISQFQVPGITLFSNMSSYFKQSLHLDLLPSKPDSYTLYPSASITYAAHVQAYWKIWSNLSHNFFPTTIFRLVSSTVITSRTTVVKCPRFESQSEALYLVI